jgi:hypothetical protein
MRFAFSPYSPFIHSLKGPLRVFIFDALEREIGIKPPKFSPPHQLGINFLKKNFPEDDFSKWMPIFGETIL